MSEVKSPPTVYPVPAGTRVAQCRSDLCGRPIYFIVHPGSGRLHPIDCDVPGGLRPSAKAHDPLQERLFAEDQTAEAAHDGRGVSHFETCPEAMRFRAGHGA